MQQQSSAACAQAPALRPRTSDGRRGAARETRRAGAAASRHTFVMPVVREIARIVPGDREPAQW